MEEEKRFFPTEEQKLMAAGRQSSLAGTDILALAVAGSPQAHPHSVAAPDLQGLVAKAVPLQQEPTQLVPNLLFPCLVFV